MYIDKCIEGAYEGMFIGTKNEIGRPSWNLGRNYFQSLSTTVVRIGINIYIFFQLLGKRQSRLGFLKSFSNNIGKYNDKINTGIIISKTIRRYI